MTTHDIAWGLLSIAPAYFGWIAFRSKYRINWRKVRRAKPSMLKTPLDWANEGWCPDCHGQLLSGPHGGMSLNVACDDCHMEWNMHHGFGTGVFKIDRTGPLSASRARMFGITVDEMERRDDRS